ncbi:hypothetical protein ACIA5C_10165 [Actinoplanes sp. NPDC051343]|uniref:hypothetical protein n=1 Tax=Actinoplanes sp. NPDC051343 TaxID=3363906 RepID=UPI0037A83529
MRGRMKWIGLGATVVVLGLVAAGRGRYEQHVHRQPDWQIHHTAVPDAAKKVDDVLAQFGRDHLYKAGDYLHSAGQHPDVQILSVTGQTHWQTGVTLVLKVTGHGVARGFDHVVIQQRDVPICFRLRMGPKEDSRDDDINCPAGAPLPVPGDPSLQGVDERLRSVLNPVGPNEAAVRAAVAGLKLDPAIHQDFTAQDGAVGVALRAGQYDCVVARVTAPGNVTLWRPSHTQLAPGELGCSAGLALSGEFNTSPH